MSSLQTLSLGILLSMCVGLLPAVAQDEPSDAVKKLEQQVNTDTKELSDEEKKLADYQEQAKWYEQFAQKRLQNADAEKQEVEKRLKLLEIAEAKKTKKDPKSASAQEITALKGWLEEEAAKRRQIEATRERWKAAIQALSSKESQTKYQIDADKASLEHQKEIEKEKAARDAENPKPAPPQVQQNTVLMPGWEQGSGTIPEIKPGFSP